MKKETYTDKTIEMLTAELAKLRSNVAGATFGKKLGKTSDLKAYRADKKNIARILTVMNTKI